MLLSYRCSAAISKLPVKLLVLAQIPPPHHGQSIMVQTLVDGLPQIAPDIEIFHVNLSLSSTTTDIGRWQPMKLIAAWRAARTAIKLARHHQVDALYYVPAPGKRIALWRDIFILRLVRPIVPRLVLHWHASGLGEWLQTSASPLERRLAHAVLDHADLALTLAPSLAADAALFQPHHTTIVPNGIADPFADRPVQRPPPTERIEVLFLGLGTAAKGLFLTLEAIAAGPSSLHLTFAGDFATPADATRFQQLAAPLGDRVRHVGFVTGATKIQLLRDSHVLCFPTSYPHEAFPLVLLEALAADLPIVTTPWRAIPELLPSGYPFFLHAPQATQLSALLVKAAHGPRPDQALRHHFLDHFTSQKFLAHLARNLAVIAG